MSWLIKNPISLWLGKLYIAKKLEWKNRDKNLKIGYLSYAKNSSFGRYNTLQDNVSLVKVDLGDFTYISFRTAIGNAKIGKFCSIGPDCKIGLGMHPSSDYVSTHPTFFSTSKRAQMSFADRDYFEETKEIKIGNDVWLGANVIVMDGVSIADGVIIAAGSVVVKDIPPYTIVGGVPAKIIKYRFELDEIEMLLQSKWWDKDIQYLQDNFKKFHNIKEFLESEKS
jgi:acetyltransferase-like isoleucine patch superfamily enzyme